MLSSIQESFEKQTIKQGRWIRSSEDRYYLLSFAWGDTVENYLFWAILHLSYHSYSVYDYKTIISIYIRFNTVHNASYFTIYDIYRHYFDKKKGTLTSEGFEKLIKKIENAE